VRNRDRQHTPPRRLHANVRENHIEPTHPRNRQHPPASCEALRHSPGHCALRHVPRYSPCPPWIYSQAILTRTLRARQARLSARLPDWHPKPCATALFPWNAMRERRGKARHAGTPCRASPEPASDCNARPDPQALQAPPRVTKWGASHRRGHRTCKRARVTTIRRGGGASVRPRTSAMQFGPDRDRCAGRVDLARARAHPHHLRSRYLSLVTSFIATRTAATLTDRSPLSLRAPSPGS